MVLTLIECRDKERWDLFVEESPQGNVFCRTAFLDALEEEYCLLLVEEDHEALAGVLLILRGGQPFPGQYPLTMYQGALLGGKLCQLPPHQRTRRVPEVLELLLTEIANRFERVALCQHYRFEDLRGFSWFALYQPDLGPFRMELQYSGLLDLGLAEDINQFLGSIRTVRRQEYRRCHASGFCVRPSRDLEMLDWLHELTFARQGIAREPEETRLLRSISQAALRKGFGELLTCVAPDGTVASATLFLFDRSCAYYWVAANHPDYRKRGCGTYLMIENIRRWQGMGLAALDFVGMNSPNRGDFKTSFNAVPVPYYMVTWDKPRSSRLESVRVDQSRSSCPASPIAPPHPRRALDRTNPRMT